MQNPIGPTKSDSSMRRANQTPGGNPTMFLKEPLQLSSFIAEEILIQILARLPVKSLLKFRCVSKSWLFLLSTPHFIKNQISISCKNPKRLNLILASRASVSVSGPGKIYTVYSVACANSSVKIAKFDDPLKIPHGSNSFLGSCNGLVCLTAVSFNMVLWNPSTGKYKDFPDPFVQSYRSWFGRYGFGYDDFNDDYKVVKIFHMHPTYEGKHENMVQVYSLRENSWKTIKGFDSGFITDHGVFVSGTLHWSISASAKIVTLSLDREDYGIIAFPHSGGRRDLSWNLGALHRSLVACYNNDTSMLIDVWVMKEYGVESSWTKLVSVSSPATLRVVGVVCTLCLHRRIAMRFF